MSKAPTKKQREQWERIRELGCVAGGMDSNCGGLAAIHHIETGMGGRKNHSRVIPLCHRHHQGDDGIHTIGRKLWQIRYGTEQELLEKVKGLLNE